MFLYPHTNTWSSTPLSEAETFKNIVNPFPHNDTFWCPWETSLLKTLGKGEIASNEQFLLFPQCFLPTWITFCHFHQIWNCRLQTLSVWKHLKFVVWERVKKEQCFSQSWWKELILLFPHNPLPEDKILDLSKLKPNTDDILNCIQNEKWVPYRVENIVRKGEIACYKQFLLFSQCFPQLYIFSELKCGIVL